MKIRILGGAGSGKSYLAKLLSKKSNIYYYDLDDIFWDNNSTSYGIKSSEEDRNKKLNEILNQNSWIIEGVYFQEWTKSTFDNADKIYILNTNINIQSYRIIKRFIMRKLNLIPNKKKETLKGLYDLLTWNKEYSLKKITAFASEISNQNPRVIFAKSADEVIKNEL